MGKNEPLKVEDVIKTVNDLYKSNQALSWFIGMGWPEGYYYCQDHKYLLATGAEVLLKNNYRAVLFAYLVCKEKDKRS